MNDSPAPAPVPPAGSPEALAAGLDWAFARLDTGTLVAAAVRDYLEIEDDFTGNLERQTRLFIAAAIDGEPALGVAAARMFAVLRGIDENVHDLGTTIALRAIAERAAPGKKAHIEVPPWFPGLREASADQATLVRYVAETLGMFPPDQIESVAFVMSDLHIEAYREGASVDTNPVRRRTGFALFTRTLLNARRALIQEIPTVDPFKVDRLLEELAGIQAEAAVRAVRPVT